MEIIESFIVFLLSVMVISLSGVLMPGPLFAVTLKKASKNKKAGALIAIGHGIVEFPLMFLIFFLLNQFEIPFYVQVAVGLIGGLLMIFMGIQTFINRNKPTGASVNSKLDSVLAGVWTTAANAGFILWWLTIGTTLILSAKNFFGLLGFSVFAGVHWSIDFLWYTIVAYGIFKTQRFWNEHVNKGIMLFCVAIFIGFGAYFFGSALWELISTMALR